jgi:hypothetical protein
MLGLLILFALFSAAGLYFILAGLLHVPTLATTKAVIAVTSRERKRAKSFDAIIFDLAVKLAKVIRLSDYKKRKMAATLKSAGITLSPEVFTAKAIVKTALVLSLLVPCLAILPMLSPVLIFLAVAVFFKSYQSADEIVRKKREAIEDELPRFVNTLTQELNATHDIPRG